ncbi:MAG TPA: YbaN family protein [Acidobacteriota bacterium]|jgi:uncharacterized protein|nr:YbaN family protein [Acidobacteriota bacterium]
MKKSIFRKWFLMSAGVLFVFIGAVGVVVPLLPTTPFLLLAAACFVRSSERLYNWMMNHRLLGPYIKNYRERRTVTRGVKATTLILLWITIGISVVVVVEQLWLKIVLIGIAAGVTWHVLSLRTLPPE